MTIIHRECCMDLPPLPPERGRRAPRRIASHDEHRVARHRFWPLDPERVANANTCIGAHIHIGLSEWNRLFGDPNAISYVEPSRYGD
jgi:hypothetical protein